MAAGGQLDVGTVQRASERESAAGARSHSSPGATANSRSPRSPAQPAMALSMPLNGLKEEDKEPLIELFVKVSARSPGVARVPSLAPRRSHAASPRPEAEPCLPRPFPLSRPRAFPPRSAAGPRRNPPVSGRAGGRARRSRADSAGPDASAAPRGSCHPPRPVQPHPASDRPADRSPNLLQRWRSAGVKLKL